MTNKIEVNDDELIFINKIDYKDYVDHLQEKVKQLEIQVRDESYLEWVYSNRLRKVETGVICLLIALQIFLMVIIFIV